MRTPLKRTYTLMTLLRMVCVCVPLLVSIPLPALAFTLQDDPSSGWDGDAGVGSINDPNFRDTSTNQYTVSGVPVKNFSGESIASLRFVVPFAWVRTSDTNYMPLEWSNALAGWHAGNFDGTDLTVRLTGATVNGSAASISVIAMGELADLSGTQQLPLTQPCTSGSPSCIASAIQPSETRLTSDSVPLFLLGAFGPNESKTFDLTFTYDFGDNRTEAFRTAFIAFTASPAPVPVPAALWLFVSGAGGFGLCRIRRLGTPGRTESHPS